MTRTLRIYYTSDTHGYFAPVDYASGKRAATGLVNCAANFERDGNSLVIDGGDTLQGSPFTYFLHERREDEGAICARLMNLCGFQFVTLGNHDFNYGRANLEQYLAALDARCLCANIEGVKGVEKTALVTLENGLRVGLTGIATHFIKIWEKPENLAGVTITEPIPAARKALEALKAQGAELTICIYHGGFENDLQSGAPLSDTGENQGWQLCRELDFDIMLSGHQHMAAEELCLFGTYSCQPPDKARSYIRMDVSVEEGRVTAHSRLCPAGDRTLPAAEAALADLNAETDRWLDTPVGHLDTALTADTPLNMAAQGSLIANFFNQVQLEASGADLSATCLGNEVKGFDRDVTIRDVVATYIYPNTLRTLRVNRAVLKAALERCASYFDFDGNGALCVSERFLKPKVEHYNFDYFAGLEVCMELRQPVGERVRSIRYQGEELAEDRSLTLCLNNYRATGTGGYEAYQRCEVVRDQPTEIVEMIMDYITRHGDITVDKTRWYRLRY